MKLFRDTGKRVHEIKAPVVTSLSREEAIGLAHLAAESAGLNWDGAVAAGATRDEAESSPVWTVVTNALHRGVHVRVQIDDTTGDTLDCRRVVI